MTEIELRRIVKESSISQELLNSLSPFFEILKENIHTKWEGLSLDDGQSAKLLKFQLKTVIALEDMMIKKVNDGKIAAKQLETD